MDNKYLYVSTFIDEFIKDIKKFREIDAKRWEPDQALHGYEDMLDNLQEHAEEIRDFDPCPEPDGEGGLIGTAYPVEWEPVDQEAKRAETKQLMKDIEYASKYH
jgi:hypothetical protein|tara:strand:- start:3 stop:314 length:312 start_codon:yes stop_codon:yes gene_type:complete